MKNVTVIGVGALGSHAAMFLRNEVNLTVIDYDTVDPKNVQAQFHGQPYLRKSKVISLEKTMALLWGTKLKTHPVRLVANNIDQLLKAPDLVLDCLDNGATRRIVQTFVRERKIPCLHGALSADGQLGRVVWDSDFTIDDESQTGQPTCEGGEHLPMIAITGAYLARSVQLWLKNQIQRGFQITGTNVMVI